MEQIGRYKIVGELGRGAMGVVYEATDPIIGRQVAIKTIRLAGLESEGNREELRKRLFREAQSAGILAHPGIITIHDVGEQGDDAYIVMELVDGVTAEQMLSSSAAQHSGTLLSVLKKSAVALDYAHGKGIIHRDVKPSNIMICRDGTVKIADFGVAKLSASTSLTQTGFVVGTPNYMSPEQAQGKTVDGRSDQFSLAVVAYRLLSGRLPFEGPTLTAILTKILWEEPEYDKVGLFMPIRAVFSRALSKDPQQRYSNCCDFVNDLEAAYERRKSESQQPMSQPEEKTAVLAENSGAKPANASAILPAAGFLSNKDASRIGVRDKPMETRLPTQKAPAAMPDGSLSSAQPSMPQEAPVAAPKRKMAFVALVGALVIVLAAIAFFAIRILHQKEAPSAEAPAVAPAEAPPYEAPSAGQQTDASKTVVSTQSKQDMKRTKAVASAQPATPSAMTQSKLSASPALEIVSDKPASSTPAVKPETSEQQAAKQQIPLEGVMTWSGRIDKNSILVITGKQASVGAVNGQLPGKPVQIVVEPGDVIIKRMPEEANGWLQIMLNSGKQKRNSIAIRWKTIE